MTPLLRDRNELIVECDTDYKIRRRRFSKSVVGPGFKTCEYNVQSCRIARRRRMCRASQPIDPLELYCPSTARIEVIADHSSISGRRSEEFRVPRAEYIAAMQGQLGSGIDLSFDGVGSARNRVFAVQSEAIPRQSPSTSSIALIVSSTSSRFGLMAKATRNERRAARGLFSFK